MAYANNEAEIRGLMEEWAGAVRNRNIDKILAHHSPNMVMYDVPPPLQSTGINAYRATWDTFFGWSQDLAVFDIVDMQVIAGDDVAFCFATMKCAGRDINNNEEYLDFRLTTGLQRTGGAWLIIHEHHSLPATTK